MVFRFKARHLYVFVFVLLALYFLGLLSHIFEKDFYKEFVYPYEGDVRRLVQQLRSGHKPDVPPINSYNYTFIQQPSCPEDENPRLVYLIKSAVPNFRHRLAIRKTWSYERRFSDVKIKTVFLLGKHSEERLNHQVMDESVKYKDILISDFFDTYFNNTIKTMMAFKWAAEHCPHSKFYMFVDDDMYVSTKNVLRFVRNPVEYPSYLMEPVVSLKKPRTLKQVMDFELPDDVRLYSGYVFVSAPHRHITSKWYVSLDEYPYNYWPPYATAGAYILSREALLDMYYASFFTKHFRFDDIYVGLLAWKTEIQPFHCDEFYFYEKPYDLLRYKYVIASHGYGDQDRLLQVWSEQKAAGNA